MLGERLGRGDPGDPRQRPVPHVGGDAVEVVVAPGHVRTGARLLVQRVAGPGVAVTVEVEQRVVAVVAPVGVVDPAPAAGPVQTVADVLVDLPGDSGFLQPLGIRRPAVAALLVAEDGPAAGSVVAGVSRPEVVAVGVGGPDERAVVRVAHGETVGERVVEGDVVPGQMGHRRRRLGRNPAVVAPVVVRLVTTGPVVVEALEELHPQVVGGRVERQRLLARRIGLVPDGPAARQCHRARVAEPPDALERPEVMVEGAVLLHQDDDVLDVFDRSGRAVGGDGGGALDTARQRGESRGRTGYLEEAAPIHISHACRASWSGGTVARAGNRSEQDAPRESNRMEEAVTDRLTAAVRGTRPSGTPPAAHRTERTHPRGTPPASNSRRSSARRPGSPTNGEWSTGHSRTSVQRVAIRRCSAGARTRSRPQTT